MSLNTFRPPKFLCTPVTLSMAGLSASTAPPAPCMKRAVRHREQDDDQQDAEDKAVQAKQRAAEPAAHKMVERHDHDRAEQRADRMAEPADDRDQRRLDREKE